MQIVHPLPDIQTLPGQFLRDYRILSELKVSNSSKVLLAIYYRNWWFRKCSIRQVSLMYKKEYKRQLNAYSNHLALCSKLPIANVVDYFEQESQSFLVLNYLQGHNLQDEIDREESSRLRSINRKRQVLTLLIEVCTIIERLHESGYVHRDISGSNFIVGKRGNVSLIDLELCVMAHETTQTLFFDSWTDGYSSPQQIKGERPNFSDDIFSFGCLMFNVLSKRHPKTLRGNMLRSQIEPLLKDHWPIGLWQLIVKCTDLNPKARPAAKDVLMTLKVCSEVVTKSSGHINDIY